jgi:hypothetical protein
MHARLVQDHVRHFGEIVFDILGHERRELCCPTGLGRLPEHHFIHPIGLFPHALAEAKRFEHFYRPAGDTQDAAGRIAARRSGAGCREKAARCAASVSPAGPLPTNRTPTLLGRLREACGRRLLTKGAAIAGSPVLKPSRWNCMDTYFHWRLGIAFCAVTPARLATILDPLTPARNHLCRRSANFHAKLKCRL